MLADEANARAAAGSGSGAGPSGAAQRSQMAPQVIDELQVRGSWHHNCCGGKRTRKC